MSVKDSRLLDIELGFKKLSTRRSLQRARSRPPHPCFSSPSFSGILLSAPSILWCPSFLPPFGRPCKGGVRTREFDKVLGNIDQLVSLKLIAGTLARAGCIVWDLIGALFGLGQFKLVYGRSGQCTRTDWKQLSGQYLI